VTYSRTDEIPDERIAYVA